jgi:hypothetical protein
MTGFFEESEGVRSMTRLTIFLVTLLIAAVVATACVYVLRGKPDAAVVAAIGGLLLTLVAKGVVAIINRNSGSDA